MKKKTLKLILIIIIFLIAILAIGSYSLFSKEIKIINSIVKYDSPHPYYYMEYKDDYHYDEIFESDISSDGELAEVLSGFISHGFYKPTATAESHIGCSTFTCMDNDGNLIWGRNFDWYDSTPIIVKSTPKGAYASISTCEFSNITGDYDSKPEDIANKFLAVAAYYVPMDGVNEKGLCVAQLEVNEGGQELVDTEKKNITITMATRMLLNKAATVDEAVELLKQYDICPSGGISSHLSIADANGKSVVIEFMNGEIIVVDTPVVTNFNIANGDTTAGGESAQKRYETLLKIHEASNGIQSEDEMLSAMEKVSQTSGTWQTRWTLVYNGLDVNYCWEGDYNSGTRIAMH